MASELPLDISNLFSWQQQQLFLNLSIQGDHVLVWDVIMLFVKQPIASAIIATDYGSLRQFHWKIVDNLKVKSFIL